MKPLTQIKLPAKLENLEKLSNPILNFARSHGFDEKQMMQINLALEEILVNVFNYSYQDTEGDIDIKCGIDRENRFIIEITDSGIPFDITQSTQPDLNSDIPNRKIGGLGIYFVKNIMDDVQYRYEDGKNIVTLAICH